MSKSVPVIMGLIFSAVVTIFAVVQYDSNKSKEQTIDNLQETLDDTEDALERTALRSQILEEENQMLRDSIIALNEVISGLKKQINNYKSEVSKYKKQLSAQKKKYNSLKKKVAALSKERSKNIATIKLLEEEKAALRAQMANTQVQMDESNSGLQQVKAKEHKQQEREADFQRAANVVNNTKVDFQVVSPRKQKHRGEIKRIRRSATNWKYTVVKFALSHTNFNMLMNETFVVKIYDLDKKKVISVVESNPAFPDSNKDSKGIDVRFDGNLVEVVHYNNRAKKSKNYDVQVYYKSKSGQQYLLRNGIAPVIRNGNRVKY